MRGIDPPIGARPRGQPAQGGSQPELLRCRELSLNIVQERAAGPGSPPREVPKPVSLLEPAGAESRLKWMISLLLAVALRIQDDTARLMAEVASEDPEIRDAAQQKLEALGLKAKEPLKKALATATGEQAARIKAILGKLPQLEVELRSTKTKHKVGEDLGLEVRLKNIWDEAVVVVGSLDGSSSCRRFPKMEIKICDESGKPFQIFPAGPYCKFMNGLRAKDFVELKPEKEFDPFMSLGDDHGFFRPPALMWKPPVPGKYSITFVYDTTAEDYPRWKGSGGAPDPETSHLFGRVYHVRLVSRPLVVNVEE